MNNKTNSFPIGTQILGRVLNANGEPIDKKGPLVDTQYVPLYSPALVIAETEANKGEVPADQIQETGIKVIDLLAPLPRGGVFGIFGNAGTGKLVVMEELIHNLITRHNGYIVCLSMDENSYEVGELMDLIREGEFEDKAVMIFEQTTESLYVQVEETVRGFRELLEGRYDDLPEQAFYFVGRIDEAIEKAKRNWDQG